MEDFVKIGMHSLSFVVTLALTLGAFSWGNSLNAQSQQPPADQQQSQPGQTPSQQAPDGQSQAQSQSQGQTFTATIVKSGDKYMLQDAASGNTYDIDHQDEVKKFEGKKVRVHGTLDASGKMIHVQ